MIIYTFWQAPDEEWHQFDDYASWLLAGLMLLMFELWKICPNSDSQAMPPSDVPRKHLPGVLYLPQANLGLLFCGRGKKAVEVFCFALL